MLCTFSSSTYFIRIENVEDLSELRKQIESLRTAMNEDSVSIKTMREVTQI
jgi:hypothetical protein